jgi:RimJ/RimL family protein N-acetyltransferase
VSTVDRTSPTRIIRGHSVFLRAAEREDIPDFLRWLNDDATTRFLALRSPLSRPLEERWFEQMLERQGKDALHFVICRLDDERAIGTIGLFEIDRDNGSAAVGIAIGELDQVGRGLGTDALNALVDFGFGELRLERIWLDVYDFNTRAVRSYEKAGFSLEGRLRRARFGRGEFHDVLRMSILRDEWAALDRPRSWQLEAEQ